MSLKTLLVTLCIVPNILYIVTSFGLPESPLWLVKYKRMADAENHLKRLRGMRYNTEPEMDDLMSSTEPCQDLLDTSFKGYMKYVTRREVYIPLSIMVVAFQFQVSV